MRRNLRESRVTRPDDCAIHKKTRLMSSTSLAGWISQPGVQNAPGPRDVSRPFRGPGADPYSIFPLTSTDAPGFDSDESPRVAGEVQNMSLGP
nr:hypothetical protein IKGEJPOP_00072 [Human alphaherpesvirus 3]